MKFLNFINIFFKKKKIINDYCIFNKKLFKENLIYEKKREILIEFNAFQINHVGLATLSNILAKKFHAQIKGYIGYSLFVSPLKYSLYYSIKWLIGNFFNLGTFKIYRSFNTRKIFKPKVTNEIEVQSNKIFNSLWKKIKKKEDILKIKIFGIHFGDLIYDTYIKAHYVPTIDLEDPKFKIFFKDYITLILFWFSYFKNHNVKAVISSHPVYSYVLPLRIAANKNILAYVLDIEHLFKITKKSPYQLSDTKYFKKIANKIDKTDLRKGKILAKKRLLSRFSGSESINMDYPDLQKSSYHKNFHKRAIKKNNKIKVLICAHEYFDAVHIYGENLFADFYEWMEFLGKLSNVTPYDWYVKTHVNQPGKYKIYQPLTIKILKDFVKKYKNITILPNNYSHQQILQEKIDYVLTVYGSIAYEYPFFNIPVINATKNHPQRSYDFSITPKTKKEYERILKNLNNFKHKINKNELYEYYYIRFIYNSSFNWLVDYKHFLKKFKNWSNMYSLDFYKHYVNEFNKNDFEKKVLSYERYLDSKNYRIRDADLIK